jgi:6-phosphogluconate dehydrogenase
MGPDMVRRLVRVGHRCVVHDDTAAAVQALACEGLLGAPTLEDFGAGLVRPGTVWLAVPTAVLVP